MVIYEDMLRDGVWYNSNLYLEDGRLYANLSGTRWIVLARNVENYTIQFGMGTLIVTMKPIVMDGARTLFRIIDKKVSISIIDREDEIYGFWDNSYDEYLKSEVNYFKSERKVVERLNSQTQGY